MSGTVHTGRVNCILAGRTRSGEVPSHGSWTAGVSRKGGTGEKELGTLHYMGNETYA